MSFVPLSFLLEAETFLEVPTSVFFFNLFTRRKEVIPPANKSFSAPKTLFRSVSFKLKVLRPFPPIQVA